MPAEPDNTGGKQARRAWGGARNRADRLSHALTLSQCQSIIAAAGRAEAIRLPLNRMITIHWDRLGITDDRAAWATGRFLTLARQWVRSRGGNFACVWVRENDAGDGSKGSHVHILAHVPHGSSLGSMQRGWLMRIAGKSYRAGVVRTGRVGGTAKAATVAPEHWRANLDRSLDYLLKGATPKAAHVLGLRRVQPGGRIIGKRCGWSQNVGSRAPLRATL